MQVPSLTLLKAASGVTRTELMVATILVTALTLLAASTVRAFSERARITQALGTGKVIQAAMTNVIATSAHAAYPVAIATSQDLVTLVNEHGAALDPMESALGVTLQAYTPVDTDGDSVYDAYTLRLTVVGVSQKRRGWCITVRPSAVEVCPPK
jgi:type II secretory pathway pseudopilin PulG